MENNSKLSVAHKSKHLKTRIMINTSELRLGNLVMVKCKEELGPATVNMISDDMIGIHWIDKLKHTIIVSNSDCFAIELTEEWLLKFGFNKMVKNIGANNHCINYIYVEWSKNGLILKAEGTIEFNTRVLYVHQLKNLYFALTGQELTASC